MLSLRSGRIFLGRFYWNLSVQHINQHKKPTRQEMQILSLGKNMGIQQSMSTVHRRTKKGTFLCFKFSFKVHFCLGITHLLTMYTLQDWMV